ncbi:TOMM precursor leader peptide-binding protein [Protaetiibacter larvae]|uniref:TOMM leader peptide-binding protein n=1 Tax=Protaetiibacter larvae TaxID=2592654 RepID=A0A5C1Y764_9MICO|nr:TOMM precursor leader peptide-binding protein [Protaetiibacter larvae]
MVLHLDPAIPMVWRDPMTVQFGVDPVVTIVPEVTPAGERLIAVLAAGVSETGYPMLANALGVSGAEAAELLRALHDCLLPDAGDSPAAPRGRILVLGDTPLAGGIARVLDDAGLRTTDPRTPALVLLVADRVVAPADHRVWLQRDIPHLPVVVGDSSITIGPLVEPGRTACLHCVGLHRRDVDPAWPAIATQLSALRAPAPHPLRAASAIAVAARMATARLRDGADPGPARELRIAGDGGELSGQFVEPHPECRCSTPPESDWAPADALARPRRPTRGRASAAPA